MRPYGFLLAFALIYLARGRIFDWLFDLLNSLGLDPGFVFIGETLFRFWN